MKSEEDKKTGRQIEEIKDVLTDWNPLEEYSKKITDLNNYDIEANDIYFNIDLELELPTKHGHLKKVQRMIREVLNGAFDLWLSDKECLEAAIKINEILKK